MPAAFTATRTSPSVGSGSGRSSTLRTSGPPYSVMTSARTRRSGGEARGGPRLALGRLFVAVLRRGVRHQGVQQVLGCMSHLVDGAVEGRLVRLRRLVGPADLADVLECRGVDLVTGRGGLEVVKCSDVSAHDEETNRALPAASRRSRP